MGASTYLVLSDVMPLTCSRTGTCCHGKQVRLNPWELYRLARTMQMDARSFRDRYCEFGGIRLRFDGDAGWKGLPACSLYAKGSGCVAHTGRPLACRFYPLGREIQGEEVRFLFQGTQFPCLEGCPEVKDLPPLSVEEYLAGQGIEPFTVAQGQYLELMQSIAEGAFNLLLESGLKASRQMSAIQSWKRMGKEDPETLAGKIGPKWIYTLMVPEIDVPEDDLGSFFAEHSHILTDRIQTAFGNLDSQERIQEGCTVLMGLALHLGRGLGANPESLSKRWILTAEHALRFPS